MDIDLELREMKRKAGFSSQKALSKWANVSEAYITKWKKQGFIPDDIKEKFENEFGKLIHHRSTESDILSQKTVTVTQLSSKVSAGYNVQAIDSVEKVGELILDISLFKTPPTYKLYAMQVDGYSMIPMIFPDSWVVFDDSKEFRGDGLYIINWDDCLMVKQISATPKKGVIQIISANKDYQSWEVDLNDTQCSFIIFGKVIRTIL